MYDDTLSETGGEGELHLSNCIAPKIEPEIVFRMKSPTEPEWMAIGFEIIDCPFPGWQFKPADFVAAYGLHRKLIIGAPSPVTAESAEQLAAFKLKLYRNDELVEEGAGRNSLRSPALCLAELARITSLTPGEFISTGTLSEAPRIAAGEVWSVKLEGLPVANLRLTLT